ncbi:MAG: hypothetical protein IIB37_09960 [Gemmatimonadetes bacterium]|nr:hypothetical protein [Gemmatimonadota bacterium]MCH8811355.1 hypothetical protein [Gemmatimonadota bacterium]
MRDRQRILDNLEKLYRGELDRSAGSAGADGGRLDFEFQRDQLYLEILLDLRDLLGESPADEKSTSSLLEKAQQLRNLTRLR